MSLAERLISQNTNLLTELVLIVFEYYNFTIQELTGEVFKVIALPPEPAEPLLTSRQPGEPILTKLVWCDWDGFLYALIQKRIYFLVNLKKWKILNAHQILNAHHGPIEIDDFAIEGKSIFAIYNHRIFEHVLSQHQRVDQYQSPNASKRRKGRPTQINWKSVDSFSVKYIWEFCVTSTWIYLSCGHDSRDIDQVKISRIHRNGAWIETLPKSLDAVHVSYICANDNESYNLDIFQDCVSQPD